MIKAWIVPEEFLLKAAFQETNVAKKIPLNLTEVYTNEALPLNLTVVYTNEALVNISLPVLQCKVLGYHFTGLRIQVQHNCTKIRTLNNQDTQPTTST